MWWYNFSSYLNQLRTSRNLTQKELASFLDVSEDTIYNIERGTTKTPYSKLLSKLSAYTGKKEYEVLRDIVFFNDKEKLNTADNFLSLFVSWFSTHGYTILYKEFSNDTSDRILSGCSLYERKRSNRIYLLLSPGDLFNTNFDLLDLLSMVQRTINHYESVIESGLYRTDNVLSVIKQKENKPAKLYEVQVVFDSNNVKEKEVFLNLKNQKTITGIGYSFYLTLFNSNNDTIDDVYKVNREY